MIQTQGPDGQQQMNVDISQTTEMKCEKCGNNTFKQTMMLRKLSAIVSPNGKETIIPVGVFACESCNHVNEEFANGGFE
jgi:hypothetical protein|tara:strand:+ start:384 stop:620 length:237 start_codon:yes stop_codon:yes gene_type:complete